jgi:TetR/AcrR family transcriptional repressor of nem operon
MPLTAPLSPAEESGLVPYTPRRQPSPGTPRGCLAVNAAMEVADHDPAVRELVREEFQRMEAAQRVSEVTPTDPAKDIALYVLNTCTDYGAAREDHEP